jgi:hypothetical protein
MYKQTNEKPSHEKEYFYENGLFLLLYHRDFSSLIFQRELTSILHNNTELTILTVPRLLCRWNE